METLTPSVGRIVHFFVDDQPTTPPFAAMICDVSPDKTRIIAGGFTNEGIPFSCINVPLLSEGQPLPKDGPFAVWPNRKPQVLVIGG